MTEPVWPAAGAPGGVVGRASRLVLATNNPHKLAELRRILTAGRVSAGLTGLDEHPGAPDVAETGASFAENALLKARAIAEFTGLPAIADDSGICVDALNGMPGIFSARWSGRHGDDTGNLELLLAQLTDVPDDRRRARFTCAAALVVPAGPGAERSTVCEAELTGRVVREPRGGNGFGYDPIFVPDGEQRTTAEMTPAEKDEISHRGKAFRRLVPAIADALS